ARESLALAQSGRAQYCYRDRSGCWYARNNRHYDDREPERSVRIDRAYVDTVVPILRQRLFQAGIRLAAVLNDTLGGPDF
ncbi:MAG: hypothetical protein AAFQ82_23570, partial [Myxococcota bacterium]